MPFLHKFTTRRIIVLASTFIALAATAQRSHASGGDAWEDFRQSVREACVTAAKDVLEVTDVKVDPFGSESYGFAILVGTEIDNPGQRILVCAFDKKTETAEISGPFEY